MALHPHTETPQGDAAYLSLACDALRTCGLPTVIAEDFCDLVQIYGELRKAAAPPPEFHTGGVVEPPGPPIVFDPPASALRPPAHADWEGPAPSSVPEALPMPPDYDEAGAD